MTIGSNRGRSRSATIDKNEDYLAGLDVRINGPFNDMEAEHMETLLDDFMKDTDIEDIYRKIFRKGMYLAQYSEAFAEEREDGLSLTDKERECIKFEKLVTTNELPTWKLDLEKWRLPWPLWRLVILCALGALVQGWDEAAVNSAQLYYLNPLRIPLEDAPFRAGIVSSAPYLCCVFSCWLTQPLNAGFGRRGTIFISCIFSAVFAFAQAFSGTSWRRLFAFRFLMGFGIGPKSATIPIYAAEAAPENVRGGLVMMWQVFTAFGIMLGYLSGVAFQNVDRHADLNWKLMLASPMVAPIILAMYIYILPESPRWLVAKAHRARNDGKTELAKTRYHSAFEALMKLRHTKLQAARDMFLIYHLLEKERKEVIDARRDPTKRWYKKGVFELLTFRRNRRALFASLTCMFAQQFCGVNIIVYYVGYVVQTFFNLGNSAVLLVSMGFGIINFTFALPAFYTIDTFGRRSLLLITFPFLALFQLLTAIALTGHEGSSHWTAKNPVLGIVAMYLFGVFYSPGEGPVPFVYAAESMPLYIRDVGMGLVTSVNWLFNWLIAFTAPRFFVQFKPFGAFLWYAVWCVLLWFMIFFFVPETRLLTLEQLDDVFSQPTRQFWRWAIDKEGKWAINRLRWWKPHPGKRPQLYESVQKGKAPARTSSTRGHDWEEMQDIVHRRGNTEELHDTRHREGGSDEMQDMRRRQRTGSFLEIDDSSSPTTGARRQ